MFFPSPLFPHQQALVNALEPLLSIIAAIYGERKDRVPTDVFTWIDTRFSSSPEPEQFYRKLLGAAPGQEPFCAADEAYFTSLGWQIRQMVPILPPDGSQQERARTELRHWIDGAGRAMIATAAAAHYLSVDLSTALQLLEARRVRRPLGPHQRVLEAYAHSIRDWDLAGARQIYNSILIVTPGIDISLPCRI